MNGAGAALSDTAAELRAGQADEIAKDPQQRHVGRRVHGMCLAVDIECCHERLLVGLSFARLFSHDRRSKRSDSPRLFDSND
jgi:hypothetical protein